MQVDQQTSVPVSRVLPGAVRTMRRSRRSGFDGLRRQAKVRRRSENAMVLISIAGLVALVGLFAHLLAG